MMSAFFNGNQQLYLVWMNLAGWTMSRCSGPLAGSRINRLFGELARINIDQRNDAGASDLLKSTRCTGHRASLWAMTTDIRPLLRPEVRESTIYQLLSLANATGILDFHPNARPVTA